MTLGGHLMVAVIRLLEIEKETKEKMGEKIKLKIALVVPILPKKSLSPLSLSPANHLMLEAVPGQCLGPRWC